MAQAIVPELGRSAILLEWDTSRQLVLTPKFERRDVWAHKAKSYLIKTILRSMPIPPLFIRLIIDPIHETCSTRCGRRLQQRLRTVLSYIRGEFPVLKLHTDESAVECTIGLPLTRRHANRKAS